MNVLLGDHHVLSVHVTIIRVDTTVLAPLVSAVIAAKTTPTTARPPPVRTVARAGTVPITLHACAHRSFRVTHAACSIPPRHRVR